MHAAIAELDTLRTKEAIKQMPACLKMCVGEWELSLRFQ